MLGCFLFSPRLTSLSLSGTSVHGVKGCPMLLHMNMGLFSTGRFYGRRRSVMPVPPAVHPYRQVERDAACDHPLLITSKPALNMGKSEECNCTPFASASCRPRRRDLARLTGQDIRLKEEGAWASGSVGAHSSDVVLVATKFGRAGG
jgi:hypothetical protein